MNSKIAVTELVEWIISNRKGSAFKDDTYEQLMDGVQEDIAQHQLLFVLNETGNLIGLVTFSVDQINFVVFVKNILVTRYSAVQIFAQHFTDNFNGYVLSARRDSEEILYDTHRLIGHLMNMKGKH